MEVFPPESHVLSFISTANEGYINHGLVEDERAQSRLRLEEHKSSQHGLHDKQRGQFGSGAVSQLSVSGRQSKQQKPTNLAGGAVSYRYEYQARLIIKVDS